MTKVSPSGDGVQPGPSNSRRDGLTKLTEREVFWRDHYNWLKTQGYLLRPRYHPDWDPKWKDQPAIVQFVQEDAVIIKSDHLLDATKLDNGQIVMLKKISVRIHPKEVEITQYFSREPFVSHPRNHCVQLLDVLHLPNEADYVILVLPLLRPYGDPWFESVGEAVEFFRQVFEGLQFIHQCHIAHRDCMWRNIMFDPTPMFPKLYHPMSLRNNRDFKGTIEFFSRTSRPVKYYFIDFGISSMYPAEDPHPREVPIFSGDKSAPEYRTPTQPCDSYALDIYLLGSAIRQDVLMATTSLGFMEPLISDMCHNDPARRPSIDQVVERFDVLYHSLSWLKLRSRLVPTDEVKFGFLPLIRVADHFLRTTFRVLLGKKAIPTPRT